MHASTALAGADLMLFASVLAYLRRCVASRARQRVVVAGFSLVSGLLLSASLWLSLS